MEPNSCYPFYDPRYRIPVHPKAPTDTTRSILQRLSGDLFYYQLKEHAWRMCQEYLSDPKAAGSDDEKIRKAIEESRAMDVLENAAVILSERMRQDTVHPGSTSHQNEVLETLRKRWQQNMNDELRAIAEETHAPFCRRRKQPRRSETLQDINDISLEGSMFIQPHPNPGNDESSARFLFDADDLVEFVMAATTPRDKSAQIWGMFSTPSQVPSFTELQQKLHRMGYWNEQVESNDNSFGIAASAFLSRYIAEGQTIMDRYSLSMARKYAQRGIPQCLRATLYRLLLHLPRSLSSSDRQEYQQLKEHVDRYELLTDDLYSIDIHLTNDDPRYFVFYEVLDEVMMCFSRDPLVYQCSSHPTYQPIQFKVEDQEGQIPHFPLNGVHPYKGLTNFAAPIAYLFDNAEEVYFVFRAMYMRYWVKLTAISSRSGTLVDLLKLFESLLCTAQPELMLHLQTLGFPPVKIASSWIQHGFAGVLEVEQILLVWDRVLAFDDLVILPALAAAIFTFRASALQTAEDADQASKIMSNCTSLKVTPLLQAFFFPAVFDA